MNQRLLALAVALALCGALPDLAAAQSNTLSAAAASVSSGNYNSAVSKLTAAINAGKMSSAETAKAFYLRGVAYRKLGKSARAIADLGAAIWLGLPSSDRLKAKVNRGLAYRAAGLDKQGDAEIAAAKRSSSAGAVDKLLAEDGATRTETASVAAKASGEGASSGSGFFSRFGLGSRNTPPPPPPAPTRTANASPNWSTSVSSGSQPPKTSAPAPKPAAAPAPAPGSWTASTSAADAPSAAEAPSGGRNRVGRWFGSLAGSSSASLSPPPAPSESAATPGRATKTAQPKPAPTTGWGSSTQIVTADASPAIGGDSYRLQLTASRSEAEARALWQKVSRKNPALASKQPNIEKTDIGSLGTFYRLQIGPFHNKAESLKLCNALKKGGVDCFLVTQ
jgi:hypothetical protein